MKRAMLMRDLTLIASIVVVMAVMITAPMWMAS